jgi:predicted exporter/lauroyl/myristoyl acyltransferase
MALLRSLPGTLFILALAAAGLWAALTLRFETELLPVLPPDLPSVQGIRTYAGLAAGQNEVFAVADPALPPEDRDRLLAETRAALTALPQVAAITTPAEQFEEQAGALAAWMLLHADEAVFAQVNEALQPAAVAENLANLPARLAGTIDPVEIMRAQLDPLGLLPDSLDPPTEDAPAFLVINPAAELTDSSADATFVDTLRRSLPADAVGRVLFTGRPVFNADISRQMRGDILLMVGAAAVLLMGAFWIFYRTLRPLGWIMFLQFFALLAGLVAARVFFGGLNVISIGFASILLGVGMDYSILVYHHFGSPHREDSAAWRTLRRAIWFSAAVTASAFYFLALTSFPALRELGVLVGTGLLASALLATWPLRIVLAARPPQAPPVLFRASSAAARFAERHRGLLTGSAIALVLSLLWLQPWSPRSGFYEAGLDRLKPIGTEAYTAQEWLQQLDPAASDAVYVVRGPDHDTIRATVSAMAGAFPGTEAGTLLAPVPSEKQREANLPSWDPDTTTRLTRAFDEAGLGPEWSGPTLQFSAVLDAAARGDTEAFAPLEAPLRTVAGRDAAGAYAVVRIPGAAEKPVPQTGWASGAASILPVSWISLSKEVTDLARRDFTRLTLAMLAAIVVLCAAAQRSVRMVALNLLALVISAALFLWLLRLTGTQLTPLSLISLPLLVGLVVDYSLHVLMALQNQRGDLTKTYDQLAAPILLTGISACIGFGAPALTGQPALQNFGLVMDFGIAAAVFACLVLLPAFFPRSAKSDYRHRGFYRFFYRRRGFEWILLGWQLLGRRGAWLISRALGLFYALTHPATVRAVRDNLSLLDPTKSGFGSACRLFMNQAENFSTYGRLSVRPTSDVVDMLGFRQGFEYLQRARDGGKGCLLVTGHLGFFELGGLVMAELGFPMTALTLPEPSTALTEWRANFRARWGVKTIVVGNDSFSVLDIVRSLHQHAFIASLADRPYDGNSVPVDLPHGRIRFSTGPVLLALLAGCPIVPVGITRQPDGLYHIEARAYIQPRWLPEGRTATLEHYTREVAACLVPLFVAYPEQWYHFAPLRCE